MILNDIDGDIDDDDDDDDDEGVETLQMGNRRRL